MEKRKKIVFVASVIHVIVLLITLLVLLVLTVVWWTRRMSMFEDKERLICEPCSVLSIRSSVNGRFPDGIPEGCEVRGDRCCCKTSLVIDKIVQKSTQFHFHSYRSQATVEVLKTDCLDEGKPSGKITGIDINKLKEATREKDLVYFNKREINSVLYSNGIFYITEPGVYYIFTQIKYEHDPEAAVTTDVRQRHALHRHSANSGYETLIENTRTFSQLQGSENNGTSFIGAVFELKKDDELMVKSTHTHKLSNNELENVFGLYLI